MSFNGKSELDFIISIRTILENFQFKLFEEIVKPFLLVSANEENQTLLDLMQPNSYLKDIKVSKKALDIIWNQLHHRNHNQIATEWRQTFAVATCQAVIAHLTLLTNIHLEDILVYLDKLLIISGSYDVIQKLASQIQKALPFNKKTFAQLSFLNEIPRTHSLSCSRFLKMYMRPMKPVIIRGEMEHWPALSKWRNDDYLLNVLSYRTLPVEVGYDYANESWSQELMRFDTFYDMAFVKKEHKAYLAQFELFEYVPELRNDIDVPSYCSAVLESGGDANPHVAINAWLGPKGTISRCHHDPCHNILAQVVGTKRIKLIHPKFTDSMYPHDSHTLKNTSSIWDLDQPQEEILKYYPEFANVIVEECMLYPGEMIYIPPKYWHYVVAEENSFSVSFWWNEWT